MPKLYFRHGPVSSAKTLNLLAVAHNYTQHGKQVLLVKPAVDTRFGISTIKSKAGLQRRADIVVSDESDLDSVTFLGVSCVLVDEAQFLDPRVIDQLREIANTFCPVICYGLRTDFQTKVFPGSLRLFELADSIEEVKTTCEACNIKAIFNLRHSEGKPVFEGNQVELGAEDKYHAMCSACYFRLKSETLVRKR
jgi:thymidine kinase